eukprot:Nk52_evm19s150 gene=Nk52_evmTU19s150
MSYVHKYVKNVSVSNLDLWGGDIVLHNLELNAENLEEEFLSQSSGIFISSGYVHELIIHFPVTQITAEPLEVTINTIEVVLMPTGAAKRRGKGHKEVDKDTNGVEKLEKQAAEQVSELEENNAPPRAGKGESSYMKQILMQIMQNITVSVNSLILKYVDSDVNVVASLSLKALRYFSVDTQGVKCFHKITGDACVVHKRLEIDDLTLCLDQVDRKGKVVVYQDPILYRFSLSCSLSTLLENFLPKALNMRVDMGSILANLSNEQMQMMALVINNLFSKEADMKHGEMKGRLYSEDSLETSNRELPISVLAPGVEKFFTNIEDYLKSVCEAGHGKEHSCSKVKKMEENLSNANTKLSATDEVNSISLQQDFGDTLKSNEEEGATWGEWAYSFFSSQANNESNTSFSLNENMKLGSASVVRIDVHVDSILISITKCTVGKKKGIKGRRCLVSTHLGSIVIQKTLFCLIVNNSLARVVDCCMGVHHVAFGIPLFKDSLGTEGVEFVDSVVGSSLAERQSRELVYVCEMGSKNHMDSDLNSANLLEWFSELELPDWFERDTGVTRFQAMWVRNNSAGDHQDNYIICSDINVFIDNGVYIFLMEMVNFDNTEGTRGRHRSKQNSKFVTIEDDALNVDSSLTEDDILDGIARVIEMGSHFHFNVIAYSISVRVALATGTYDNEFCTQFGGKNLKNAISLLPVLCLSLDEAHMVLSRSNRNKELFNILKIAFCAGMVADIDGIKKSLASLQSKYAFEAKNVILSLNALGINEKISETTLLCDRNLRFESSSLSSPFSFQLRYSSGDALNLYDMSSEDELSIITSSVLQIELAMLTLKLSRPQFSFVETWVHSWVLRTTLSHKDVLFPSFCLEKCPKVEFLEACCGKWVNEGNILNKSTSASQVYIELALENVLFSLYSDEYKKSASLMLGNIVGGLRVGDVSKLLLCAFDTSTSNGLSESRAFVNLALEFPKSDIDYASSSFIKCCSLMFADISSFIFVWDGLLLEWLSDLQFFNPFDKKECLVSCDSPAFLFPHFPLVSKKRLKSSRRVQYTVSSEPPSGAQRLSTVTSSCLESSGAMLTPSATNADSLSNADKRSLYSDESSVTNNSLKDCSLNKSKLESHSGVDTSATNDLPNRLMSFMVLKVTVNPFFVGFCNSSSKAFIDRHVFDLACGEWQSICMCDKGVFANRGAPLSSTSEKRPLSELKDFCVTLNQVLRNENVEARYSVLVTAIFNNTLVFVSPLITVNSKCEQLDFDFADLFPLRETLSCVDSVYRLLESNAQTDDQRLSFTFHGCSVTYLSSSHSPGVYKDLSYFHYQSGDPFDVYGDRKSALKRVSVFESLSLEIIVYSFLNISKGELGQCFEDVRVNASVGEIKMSFCSIHLRAILLLLNQMSDVMDSVNVFLRPKRIRKTTAPTLSQARVCKTAFISSKVDHSTASVSHGAHSEIESICEEKRGLSGGRAAKGSFFAQLALDRLHVCFLLENDVNVNASRGSEGNVFIDSGNELTYLGMCIDGLAVEKTVEMDTKGETLCRELFLFTIAEAACIFDRYENVSSSTGMTPLCSAFFANSMDPVASDEDPVRFIGKHVLFGYSKELALRHVDIASSPKSTMVKEHEANNTKGPLLDFAYRNVHHMNEMSPIMNHPVIRSSKHVPADSANATNETGASVFDNINDLNVDMVFEGFRAIVPYSLEGEQLACAGDSFIIQMHQVCVKYEGPCSFNPTVNATEVDLNANVSCQSGLGFEGSRPTAENGKVITIDTLEKTKIPSPVMSDAIVCIRFKKFSIGTGCFKHLKELSDPRARLFSSGNPALEWGLDSDVGNKLRNEFSIISELDTEVLVGLTRWYIDCNQAVEYAPKYQECLDISFDTKTIESNDIEIALCSHDINLLLMSYQNNLVRFLELFGNGQSQESEYSPARTHEKKEVPDKGNGAQSQMYRLEYTAGVNRACLSLSCHDRAEETTKVCKRSSNWEIDVRHLLFCNIWYSVKNSKELNFSIEEIELRCCKNPELTGSNCREHSLFHGKCRKDPLSFRVFPFWQINVGNEKNATVAHVTVGVCDFALSNICVLNILNFFKECVTLNGPPNKRGMNGANMEAVELNQTPKLDQSLKLKVNAGKCNVCFHLLKVDSSKSPAKVNCSPSQTDYPIVAAWHEEIAILYETRLVGHQHIDPVLISTPLGVFKTGFCKTTICDMGMSILLSNTSSFALGKGTAYGKHCGVEAFSIANCSPCVDIGFYTILNHGKVVHQIWKSHLYSDVKVVGVSQYVLEFYDRLEKDLVLPIVSVDKSSFMNNRSSEEAFCDFEVLELKHSLLDAEVLCVTCNGGGDVCLIPQRNEVVVHEHSSGSNQCASVAWRYDCCRKIRNLIVLPLPVDLSELEDQDRVYNAVIVVSFWDDSLNGYVTVQTFRCSINEVSCLTLTSKQAQIATAEGWKLSVRIEGVNGLSDEDNCAIFPPSSLLACITISSLLNPAFGHCNTLSIENPNIELVIKLINEIPRAEGGLKLQNTILSRPKIEKLNTGNGRWLPIRDNGDFASLNICSLPLLKIFCEGFVGNVSTFQNANAVVDIECELISVFVFDWARAVDSLLLSCCGSFMYKNFDQSSEAMCRLYSVLTSAHKFPAISNTCTNIREANLLLSSDNLTSISNCLKLWNYIQEEKIIFFPLHTSSALEKENIPNIFLGQITLVNETGTALYVRSSNSEQYVVVLPHSAHSLTTVGKCRDIMFATSLTANGPYTGMRSGKCTTWKRFVFPSKEKSLQENVNWMFFDFSGNTYCFSYIPVNPSQVLIKIFGFVHVHNYTGIDICADVVSPVNPSGSEAVEKERLRQSYICAGASSRALTVQKDFLESSTDDSALLSLRFKSRDSRWSAAVPCERPTFVDKLDTYVKEVNIDELEKSEILMKDNVSRFLVVCPCGNGTGCSPNGHKITFIVRARVCMRVIRALSKPRSENIYLFRKTNVIHVDIFPLLTLRDKFSFGCKMAVRLSKALYISNNGPRIHRSDIGTVDKRLSDTKANPHDMDELWQRPFEKPNQSIPFHFLDLSEQYSIFIDDPGGCRSFYATCGNDLKDCGVQSKVNACPINFFSLISIKRKLSSSLFEFTVYSPFRYHVSYVDIPVVKRDPNGNFLKFVSVMKLVFHSGGLLSGSREGIIVDLIPDTRILNHFSMGLYCHFGTAASCAQIANSAEVENNCQEIEFQAVQTRQFAYRDFHNCEIMWNQSGKFDFLASRSYIQALFCDGRWRWFSSETIALPSLGNTLESTKSCLCTGKSIFLSFRPKERRSDDVGIVVVCNFLWIPIYPDVGQFCSEERDGSGDKLVEPLYSSLGYWKITFEEPLVVRNETPYQLFGLFNSSIEKAPALAKSPLFVDTRDFVSVPLNPNSESRVFNSHLLGLALGKRIQFGSLDAWSDKVNFDSNPIKHMCLCMMLSFYDTDTRKDGSLIKSELFSRPIPLELILYQFASAIVPGVHVFGTGTDSAPCRIQGIPVVVHLDLTSGGGVHLCIKLDSSPCYIIWNRTKRFHAPFRIEHPNTWCKFHSKYEYTVLKGRARDIDGEYRHKDRRNGIEGVSGTLKPGELVFPNIIVMKGPSHGNISKPDTAMQELLSSQSYAIIGLTPENGETASSKDEQQVINLFEASQNRDTVLTFNCGEHLVGRIRVMCEGVLKVILIEEANMPKMCPINVDLIFSSQFESKEENFLSKDKSLESHTIRFGRLRIMALKQDEEKHKVSETVPPADISGSLFEEFNFRKLVLAVAEISCSELSFRHHFEASDEDSSSAMQMYLPSIVSSTNLTIGRFSWVNPEMATYKYSSVIFVPVLEPRLVDMYCRADNRYILFQIFLEDMFCGNKRTILLYPHPLSLQASMRNIIKCSNDDMRGLLYSTNIFAHVTFACAKGECSFGNSIVRWNYCRELSINLSPSHVYLEQLYLIECFQLIKEYVGCFFRAVGAQPLMNEICAPAERGEYPDFWVIRDSELAIRIPKQQLEGISFIERLHIGELIFQVSMEASVKVYLSLVETPVRFSETLLLNVSVAKSADVLQLLSSKFTKELLFSIPSLLSSFEMFGNVSGLLRDIQEGISDLVLLPIEGLRKASPSETVYGVLGGAGSLATHLLAGSLKSVISLSHSLSRNVGALSLDKEHQEWMDQSRINSQSAYTTPLQGITEGAAGLGFGVLSGIAGLVHQPLLLVQKQITEDAKAERYENETPNDIVRPSESAGFGDYAVGFGKGVVGAVAKPMSGIFGLIAHSGQGVLNIVEDGNTQRRRHSLSNSRLEVGEDSFEIYSINRGSLEKGQSCDNNFSDRGITATTGDKRKFMTHLPSYSAAGQRHGSLKRKLSAASDRRFNLNFMNEEMLFTLTQCKELCSTSCQFPLLSDVHRMKCNSRGVVRWANCTREVTSLYLDVLLCSGRFGDVINGTGGTNGSVSNSKINVLRRWGPKFKKVNSKELLSPSCDHELDTEEKAEWKDERIISLANDIEFLEVLVLSSLNQGMFNRESPSFCNELPLSIIEEFERLNSIKTDRNGNDKNDMWDIEIRALLGVKHSLDHRFFLLLTNARIIRLRRKSQSSSTLITPPASVQSSTSNITGKEHPGASSTYTDSTSDNNSTAKLCFSSFEYLYLFPHRKRISIELDSSNPDRGRLKTKQESSAQLYDTKMIDFKINFSEELPHTKAGNSSESLVLITHPKFYDQVLNLKETISS